MINGDLLIYLEWGYDPPSNNFLTTYKQLKAMLQKMFPQKGETVQE